MMKTLSKLALLLTVLFAIGCGAEQKVDTTAVQDTATKMSNMKAIFDATPDKKWESVSEADRQKLIKENGSETEARNMWDLFVNPPKVPGIGGPAANRG